MARKLTVIEGFLIFAALCGTLYFLSGPALAGWQQWLWLVGQAAAFALFCVVTFYYNDLYDPRAVWGFTAYISRLPQSLIPSLAVFSVYYAVFLWNQLPALPFFGAFLGIFAILSFFRMAFYAILSHPRFSQRVLILGLNSLAQKLIAEILSQPYLRYSIVGVVSEDVQRAGRSLGCPVLGPMDRLAEIIESTKPDRIIVATTDRRRLPVRWLLGSRLWGIAIEDGVEVYERFTGKLAIEWLTPSGLIFSQGFQKSSWHIAWGRAMGIAVSLVGLVLFAPLIGLIALAIKIDSPGPVFFIQRRVGLGSRPFNLIKFRTMLPTERPTSEWARDNGDRITRLGQWLRKFRLDELPQFINILRGDMNLVGPRPHPVSNFNLFVLVLRNAPECGEEIPYYSLRSWIRPGITGWAQVRYGYANGLEEEIEKARYDLYYVKYMSIWFDLRILLDTVKVVFLGHESQAPEAYPIRTSIEADAR